MTDSKYHFFWNGSFSQWSTSPFDIQGIHYTCCEQWMMHKKALFFRDFTIADKIMETMHPKEQKSLGRQIHNFDAEAWNEVCQNIVYEGNFAKFKNPKLREYLLATGNEIIVEASPYDAIWGIGFGAEDALENIDKWGQNLLGKAIMRVRDDIRSEMNDTTKEI